MLRIYSIEARAHVSEGPVAVVNVEPDIVDTRRAQQVLDRRRRRLACVKVQGRGAATRRAGSHRTQQQIENTFIPSTESGDSGPVSLDSQVNPSLGKSPGGIPVTQSEPYPTTSPQK